MIALKIAFGLLAAAIASLPTPKAEEPSVYVGEFTITSYCPCSICCGKWADGMTAAGVPATPGVVAVDPDVIPLGSIVVIGGQEYIAADTGCGVKGMHIDICADTHESALEFGVQTADVWVVPPKH